MSLSTTPRTWVAGEIPTAAIFNAHVRDMFTGLEASWDAYSPTWTGATTNPTLASHTIAGAWYRVGKTIKFRILITFGASGYGSGSYIFGLPVAAVAGFNNPFLLTSVLYDLSVPSRATRMAYLANTTSFTLTDLSGGNVTNTNPFTWASGDTIAMLGEYEAA